MDSCTAKNLSFTLLLLPRRCNEKIIYVCVLNNFLTRKKLNISIEKYVIANIFSYKNSLKII